MTCPQCHERFPANREVACAPGGQEAPGTFLIVAAAIYALGAVLHLGAVGVWPWVLYSIGGFVLLQAGVAWIDCRGASCLRCGCRVRVWLWSR
jgi:hypothetical protein